jgi:hypothetical protein
LETVHQPPIKPPKNACFGEKSQKNISHYIVLKISHENKKKRKSKEEEKQIFFHQH